MHQTLSEFIQFFHQPDHFPDLQSVHNFLSLETCDAFQVLSEAYYQRMYDMLPLDIHKAFDEGLRFEHPLPPDYYSNDNRA